MCEGCAYNFEGICILSLSKIPNTPCKYYSEDIDLEVWNKLAKLFYLLKQRRKEIDEKLKTLRLIFSKRVDSRQTFGNYVVSVTKYKTKKLNTKLLKEFLGENYDEFLTEVEQIRVDVKKLGGDVGER